MNNLFEKEYWSKKFADRDKLLAVEPFLADNIGYLKKGTVLDFACGDGRNAVYLAKAGYKVTGADFSIEGLNKLLGYSRQFELEMETKEIDLRNHVEVGALGSFDNIIISHYKPEKKVFEILPSILDNGGILLICAFNYRQSIENGFPREFCLEENELIGLYEELMLLKHEVFSDDRAFLDGYIFCKK